MRSGRLLLSVGVVLLAGGCSKPREVPPPTGPGKVTITLNCDGNGATIGVHPWRVALASRADSISWTLAGPTGVSVSITPKDPARWPFEAPPPIVVGSQAGIGKNVPQGVAAGVYKYNVTGVCTREGQAGDTVVIDPDMIIPT